MALEQKYLNTITRGEGYMEIMMYIPDPNVRIGNISSNDILQYSNIDSLKDVKMYTNTTIATLEENLWLLNGGYVNPTIGRKYNGYISNSMSNEDGHFGTNPVINIDLYSTSNVEFFSLILNPAVKSGYPKQIKLQCFDSTDNQIGTDYIMEIRNVKTLPSIMWELNLQNVSKLKLEFIDTETPYRRIRVSSLMFGKILSLNDQDIMSSDYLDKCSFVPDTIPSRTFSFTVNNYSKAYNVDNPNNSYIDLDRQTRVLIRNGYNIYGYEEVPKTEFEEAYSIINNPDKMKEIEWDDWKELRLLNISTDGGDTCTFECGSILDMMTDVYTAERFTNNRTVRYIIANLLNFMGLSTDIIQFSSDNNGVSYGDYTINTVLPELPVRELIQLLAFSVGATILIKDDGTIKFANLDLDVPSTFTHQHSFTYRDFESEPSAEQLEHTNKISIPKYNSSIGNNEEEISTLDVSAYNVDVSYSPCVPTGASVPPDDTSGGSVQASDLYTHRGTLTMNLPNVGTTKVKIYGYRIDTVQTQDRTITNDTLIIDTKLMSQDKNNAIKNKYSVWYDKKFKYRMNTRGEPLVDAGDYAEIQTPFTVMDQNNQPTDLLHTFVLQNHIAFDGSWSGDMEVIAL